MDKAIKLLIVCQKVDSSDDLLGFFHGWIKEFAKHCQQVTVICLYKGKFNLPENINILSLGKEKNFGFWILDFGYIKKLKYLLNLFHYIWNERYNYDCVFVHMNHEYVVIAGWWWKLIGKKIVLWHAHKAVNWKLRFSEKLVDYIVTSTKSGCRLKSDKVRIVGQGIDVDKFEVKSAKLKVDKNIFKIITIGRISPIKDYETFINAVELVNRSNQARELKVEIIGTAAVTEDEAYLNKLKGMIKEKNLENIFKFTGAVANKDIASYLQAADLFVNTSLTGSLDKAVLEAMAAGLPILTCNEAFLDVLGQYREKLMFPKSEAKLLAQKILYMIKMTDREKERIIKDLQAIVARDHSLENLALNILQYCR